MSTKQDCYSTEGQDTWAGQSNNPATDPQSQTETVGKLRAHGSKVGRSTSPRAVPEDAQLASDYNWGRPELRDKGDPFAALSAHQELVPSQDQTLGIDDNWEDLETES